MKKILASVVALLLGAGGCATHPNSLKGTSASDLKYDALSCKQISVQATDARRRIVALYDVLADKADGDVWQTGLGLTIFWPALFLLEGGDGAEAVEYQTLQGDYVALQQEASAKECKFVLPTLEDVLMVHSQEKDEKAGVSRDGKPEYPGKKR